MLFIEEDFKENWLNYSSDFKISDKSSIYLGPNGIGKTTTYKVIKEKHPLLGFFSYDDCKERILKEKNKLKISIRTTDIDKLKLEKQELIDSLDLKNEALYLSEAKVGHTHIIISGGEVTEAVVGGGKVRVNSEANDFLKGIATVESVHIEVTGGIVGGIIGGGIALMRGGAERLSRLLGRRVYVSMPRTSLMNTVNYAPAFALAQFMLYGSGSLAVGNRRLVDNIVGNIRDFFAYRQNA